MAIKQLLLALLTACGASPTPTSKPDDVEPPGKPEVEEDQHFCCSFVDLDKWTGEDCVAINKENINTCAAVLYCPGLWGKNGGTTKCAR